jgi:hypothetical protein
MEHKRIDFVGYFSGLLSVVSVLGNIALNVGPWGARPDGRTASMVLSISFLAFGMVSLMATNVGKILVAQADQIADLRRQLANR